MMRAEGVDFQGRVRARVDRGLKWGHFRGDGQQNSPRIPSIAAANQQALNRLVLALSPGGGLGGSKLRC